MRCIHRVVWTRLLPRKQCLIYRKRHQYSTSEHMDSYIYIYIYIIHGFLSPWAIQFLRMIYQTCPFFRVLFSNVSSGSVWFAVFFKFHLIIVLIWSVRSSWRIIFFPPEWEAYFSRKVSSVVGKTRCLYSILLVLERTITKIFLPVPPFMFVWLIGCVLWHINSSRLSNAKSYLYRD